MNDRSKPKIALTPILLGLTLIALAGCKGEGTGGNSGVPNFARGSYVTSFNTAAVNAARNEAEFATQNMNWYLISDPSTTYSSFSLRAVRAEYAHSVNLSGNGEIIAIVDGGFYLNHPELVNKTITIGGVPMDPDDHGTSVAAIAAGLHDGSGIMGIAYNADLHLTDFDNTFTALAEATDQARNMGAIVQNNSWGYEGPSINDVLNRPLGVTAEEAIADLLGKSVGGVNSYMRALERFTVDGVVVFANSNIFTTELDLMAGLPLVFPALESGWIIALNSVPTFNGSGEIVSAMRLSGECFQMAASCLTAEGVIRGTSGSSGYYAPDLGTSFAAPIISGGVAILAEAFPSLSGPEIRDRLLVTADNGFFTPDGTRAFGGGITHGYSSEYGHGFMDLKAALLPIGGIGVPLGLSVSDGFAPVASRTMVTGGAQGDALARGLAGEKIMLLDALGGDFALPAKSLLVAAPALTRQLDIARFIDPASRRSDISMALAAGAASLDARLGMDIVAGDAEDVSYALGLTTAPSGLLTGATSMLDTRADSQTIGWSMALGDNTSLAMHLSSDFAEGGNAQAYGMALGFGGKQDRFTIGFSILDEQGSALGLQSLTGTGQARSQAIDLGYSRLISKDLTLQASAQFGTTSSDATGIWGAQHNNQFNAVGLDLTRRNLLQAGDELRFSLRQPLAITSGTIDVALAQSRDSAGNITTRSVEIDLAPSARQLDIGLEYARPLGEFASFGLGAAYSLNSGSVAGVNHLGLAARFNLRF